MKFKIQLYDLHKELGASFGEFVGWSVPMMYTSAVSEYMSVRKHVGVFDVSHMGRLLVEGKDSFKLLQKLVCRDLERVPINHMSGPSALLNENGGFKDDVMVYNIGNNKWLIVCNAVNRVKVIDWIKEWINKLKANVDVMDLTFNLSMIAVQGPYASSTFKNIGLGFITNLNPLEFRTNINTSYGEVFLISRSGWTGEDGFEIIAEPSVIEKIYRKVIDAAAKPCGIIARDMLRIEMGYVLYGHEIDENITPIEARYWVWSEDKKDYIGWEAIRKKIKEGVDKLRYGLKLGRGIRVIPRPGHKVYVKGEDTVVGEVTSGTFSPLLGRSIAMVYIDSRHAIPGLSVEIEIRDKRYRAKIVDFPFIVR